MKLAVVGLVALFSATPSTSIDLVKVFRPQLTKIHRATKVPVLLPDKLPRAGGTHFRVYATGGATRGGWNLELAAAKNCGGANACFVASFAGRRHGIFPRNPNLRLATGDRALFQSVSCGASCAPASLWFTHGGFLYSWQVKAPPRHARQALAALAAQAIRTGPR
jgi:hypothetical protein